MEDWEGQTCPIVYVILAVLLPKEHPFTALVVRRAHHRVIHLGLKATLMEIRNRFWIPQGRSLVRQFINTCIICQRFVASSYRPPPPPPLPKHRVQQRHPFSSVGVDYAGPLIVKRNAYTANKNGRQNALTSCTEKEWLCLFTCGITCAIHIDIVTDLSPQSFIRCLK